MGYDSKATLVKKEIKQLAGNDKHFLKLMKDAIETQNKSAQFKKQQRSNNDTK